MASVLRDSMNEVVDLVTLGYRVKLPALGNIYTTLSSEGEVTADSVSFKTKVATRSKFTNFSTVSNENDEISDDDTDTGTDSGSGGSSGTGNTGEDNNPL